MCNKIQTLYIKPFEKELYFNENLINSYQHNYQHWFKNIRKKSTLIVLI